ncbi:hypothetical protein HDV63DRAFT_142724 [Trichoderma sp. SZMC 28014]
MLVHLGVSILVGCWKVTLAIDFQTTGSLCGSRGAEQSSVRVLSHGSRRLVLAAIKYTFRVKPNDADADKALERRIAPSAFAYIERAENKTEVRTSDGTPVSNATKCKSTVAGSMRWLYRNSGSLDTARWVLTEDASQKSGMDYLQTAILVERPDDMIFRRHRGIREVCQHYSIATVTLRQILQFSPRKCLRARCCCFETQELGSGLGGRGPVSPGSKARE